MNNLHKPTTLNEAVLSTLSSNNYERQPPESRQENRIFSVIPTYAISHMDYNNRRYGDYNNNNIQIEQEPVQYGNEGWVSLGRIAATFMMCYCCCKTFGTCP